MERIDFPDYEDHRRLHRRFIADIHRILIDLRNGRPIPAIYLIDFIKKWLVGHILVEDAKIGMHHKSQLEENLRRFGGIGVLTMQYPAIRSGRNISRKILRQLAISL